MQKITPFLMFDGKAEEAINFYVSVFKNAKILEMNRLQGPNGPMAWGTFEIEGQKFMALDGGPMFSFTQGISLYVDCHSQEEVDDLWNKLTSDGGEENVCGWLQDKYGLSWQIIPTALTKYMHDKDRVKAQRVMQAMMTMRKIDIATLEAAYNAD